MNSFDDRTGGIDRHTVIQGLIATALAVALSSCSSLSHQANLGEIYNSAAQRDEVDRNPIIVIPGILGSKLKEESTGDPVWGIIGGGGRHTRGLALPMKSGESLAEIEDGVVANGVLDKIILKLGAPVSVKAYAQLLAALGVGGYRDEELGETGAIDYGDKHYTCFQFGYDWRRSSAENAAALGKFIEEKRRYVEAERRKRHGRSGKVKFDIVAHSMGGLIARYFMRYGGQPLPYDGSLPNLSWAGLRDLDKVILVGTPNGGSTYAVKQLVEGYKPAPIVESFPAGQLGTMPSIYEMLPRVRQKMALDSEGHSLDLFDLDVWKSNHLGLADPRQEKVLKTLLPEISDPAQRRMVALDHLRKCLENAAQFQAAMDRPVKLPPGAKLYLFAGDSEPTLEKVELSHEGKLKELTTAPGDGTVTRYAALLDERVPGSGARMQFPVDWTNATFIAAGHLDLTRNPAFINNVLHLLLER